MKTEILGVKVDALSKDEVLEKIKVFLNSAGAKIITTTYSEFVVEAQKDEEFKNILNQADLNLADGIGILWAAAFLTPPASPPCQGGDREGVIATTLTWFLKTAWWTAFNQAKIKNVIPERISGADLVYDICEIAQDTGRSVYLLGGHGAVDKALVEKYPNLKIAGRHEGSPDEPGLIEKLSTRRVDILLVAFGPVKQEYWLWKNKDKLNVKIAMGVGGAFDYIVGRRKRAGGLWQKFGLEWLHRLFTQPWRLRRMWNAIIVFSWKVVSSKL